MLPFDLAHYFTTPSSFPNDPRGFALNAAGHALIVGALPAVFWPAALVVLIPVYALWEAAQWRYERAEAWDCIEDVAFVSAGALAVHEPMVFGPLFFFWLAGIFRRKAA